MTLEQMLKWKHGSFEDYKNLINEQEKHLKHIRKLNIEIEKAEDARSCFNCDNPDEIEKWMQYDNKIYFLLNEKKCIDIQIKENNQRLEREFH